MVQEARLIRSLLVATVVLSACHNRFVTIGPKPPVARPAPAPVPTVDTTDWVAYRVQPGDTIARLSRCSGSSMEQLSSANVLPDPRALKAGRAVLLPPAHACEPPAPALPVVAAAPPPPQVKCEAPSAPSAILKRAQRLLDEAEQRQDQADFTQAQALAQDCTRALQPYALDPDADATRARCHALAGMASAGLGQRERAIEEFRRAFAIEPRLQLDPAADSPRVRELVQAARS
jgi:hypothetical protein